MTKKVEDFYKSLRGKRVAFIGTGVTNQSCIELFAKYGAVITLCDKKPNIEAFGEYAASLKSLNIALSLGERYLDGLQNQDMIMRTPGFEYFTKELQEAKAAGTLVTSEMQLFFELCPCEIVAVTGSDGKTTTTSLIAAMLEEGGRKVHLGGNLGRALLPVVEKIDAGDVAAVELSSFQLISMHVSPTVAVITNVTPNHLDHHKDMQEYVEAKRNLIRYQNGACKTVLGYENGVTRAMESDVKGSLKWFTRLHEVENGGFIDADGMLCMAEKGSLVKIVNKKEVALRGEHNLENLLAAMCAVWGMVPVEAMAAVAHDFAGVEHRIEPVRKLNGVQWYNDSIATSPTRVIAGLRAFEQKMIIIAGGSDKGISFAPLVPELFVHVKTLILMGATANRIEQACRENVGFDTSGLVILHAKNMAEAVKIAQEVAKDGDIVSLSPACASFDAYPNFEVRGREFKALVNAL